MNQETKDLIRYRLDRANETLEEALVLLEKEHVNTFVNRLLCMFLRCFCFAAHQEPLVGKAQRGEIALQSALRQV